MRLLSRLEFQTLARERDGHRCVICNEPAEEVHHIIERKLFTDGGYYLNNAATLCPKHHLLAEQTKLSCEEIRDAAKIVEIVLPDHFDTSYRYDKWGNVMLPNGTRSRGEMFYTEQVQKILKDDLHLYSKYVKYPRTYHMPNSNIGSDDKRLKDDSIFHDKKVVVTVKMDGENSTLYNDYMHARSLNSGDHDSRNWLKGLWGNIKYLIDEDMRLCGENMYALHTVKYDNLDSYFLLFSVWYRDTCLSWDETKDYAKILDLSTVPVLYEGIYDLVAIEKSFQEYEKHNPIEGYVIRLSDEFKYFDFKNSVAKYVKPEFMTELKKSTGHWQSKKIIANRLASSQKF